MLAPSSKLFDTFGFAVVMSIAAAFPATGYAEQSSAQEIADKTTKYVVYIRTARGSASGVVLPVEFSGYEFSFGKFVATNYHVVVDDLTVDVFHPYFGGNGLVNDVEWYAKYKNLSYREMQRRQLPTDLHDEGIVVARDKKKDIAIIHRASIPSLMHKTPIHYSFEIPDRGDKVYLIGNPKSRPLWTFGVGEYSFYEPHHKHTVDGEAREYDLHSFVSNLYFGNSGGPLFNTEGALIGINASGTVRDSVTRSSAVHISEVKSLASTIVPRALVCLYNRTDSDVSFSWKWMSSSRKTKHLAAKTRWIVNSPLDDYDLDGPRLQIWFDNGRGIAKHYSLKYNIRLFGYGATWDLKKEGRGYFFDERQGVDLYGYEHSAKGRALHAKHWD